MNQLFLFILSNGVQFYSTEKVGYQIVNDYPDKTGKTVSVVCKTLITPVESAENGLNNSLLIKLIIKLAASFN